MLVGTSRGQYIINVACTRVIILYNMETHYRRMTTLFERNNNIYTLYALDFNEDARIVGKKFTSSSKNCKTLALIK